MQRQKASEKYRAIITNRYNRAISNSRFKLSTKFMISSGTEKARTPSLTDQPTQRGSDRLWRTSGPRRPPPPRRPYGGQSRPTLIYPPLLRPERRRRAEPGNRDARGVVVSVAGGRRPHPTFSSALAFRHPAPFLIATAAEEWRRPSACLSRERREMAAAADAEAGSCHLVHGPPCRAIGPPKKPSQIIVQPNT